MIMQQFMLGLMKLLYYQFMNPEYILYAWRQRSDKGYKISVACNISYAAYLLAQVGPPNFMHTYSIWICILNLSMLNEYAKHGSLHSTTDKQKDNF